MMDFPFARYYLFALLAVIPMALIFKRAGFKPAYAALLAVPDVGFFLCLCLLAFQKWKGAGA